MKKFLFPVPKNIIPQVKTRYPFVYMEKCKLEAIDHCVYQIDKNGSVSIPAACINCVILGPGTSITHEAVKIFSEFNCHIFWSGLDGLRFYASGISPTNKTVNFNRQMSFCYDKDKALVVAKHLFAKRFKIEDIANVSIIINSIENYRNFL